MSNPKSISFKCDRCDLTSDTPETFTKDGPSFWFVKLLLLGGCLYLLGKSETLWGAICLVGMICLHRFSYPKVRCPRCLAGEDEIKEKHHY
jgi:hypothetical protein